VATTADAPAATKPTATGPQPATRTATAVASADVPRRPAATATKRPAAQVAMATKPPATAPVETRPAPVKPPTTVATAEPPAPPPPPDPEIERRRREVAQFVTELRETGINATSPEIKDAWRARSAQLARQVVAEPKSYTPELRTAREKLRARFVQLDGAFRSVAAPLDVKLPAGVEAAWATPLAGALRAAAPRRTDTLKDLVDVALLGDPKFDDSLATLIDADEQWRASAGKLVADAGRAQRLLDAGHAPTDPTADGQALAGALAAVRGSDAYKVADVRQALDPLVRPVAAVETETAPAALRAIAAADGRPLGVRLAAWAKAGGQASRETLDGDLKLAQSLVAAARSKLSADKPRADAIKARLEADVRGRWLALLDGASSGQQDVEAAVAVRDRFADIADGGAGGIELSPRARFNLALADLRGAAAATAGGDDAAAKLAPAADKARKALAALDASVARQPSVAAVASELDRLAKGAGPVDFSKLGPMSDGAAVKVAWAAAAEDGGDKVTYRAALPTDAGKEEVSLVFRRVRPTAAGAAGASGPSPSSSAAAASWVLTSEVSLGLFCDLIQASGKWADVRGGGMLVDYNPARGDPRAGPRTWEWPRYGRAPGAVRSLVWLSPDFVPARLDHYPDSIGSEFNRSVIRDARGERAEELNPSRRQPMQHVSARAARLAAAAAGCRLPTVAEWQAAYQSASLANAQVSPNLRDRTWRLQLEHVGKPAYGNRCRPDAGIFIPDGERATDDVWRQSAGGAEWNDGVLWFREAPAAAAAFADLAGNVAEFTTDDAGGAKVYVIGGSAMSPPSRPLDKAFAVPDAQLTSGFADVGFRLAFNAPPVDTGKLRDAIAGNWYLTGK
jgi:formylglycine-generating enzyme required for sulfatase activity